MKRTIKCMHCGYIWETSTKKKFVSCPDCLRKTMNIPYHNKEREAKNNEQIS